MKKVLGAVLIVGLLVGFTAYNLNPAGLKGQLTFTQAPPTPPDHNSLTPTLQITNLSAENPVFDPTDDQEAEVEFTISSGAYITAKIYDEDREEIAKIAENRYYERGQHSLEWNGRDRFADLAYDGEYTFTLTATYGDQSDKESTELYVRRGYDNAGDLVTAPRLKRVYATKQDFDPTSEKNYLVFTITEPSDIRAELFDRNGLRLYEVVDRKDLSAGTHKILIDNDELRNQEEYVTYELRVSNSKGQDKYTGEIKLNPEDDRQSGKPNLLGDEVKDGHPYTPKGQNKLGISFKLDRESEITIEIRDDDYIVATVSKEVELAAGSHTLYWDGRDKFDDYISDGLYQYKIIAGNFRGKDTEYGNFSVTGGGLEDNQFADNCAGFSDVHAKSEQCKAITWAKENDVVQGYDDGQFRPNTPVKRTEALKMILVALNAKIVTNNGQSLGFSDTNRFGWYADFLRTGLSLGIVKGYSDGAFRPENPVLRAEAIVMLLNTARSTDKLIIPTANYGQPYFDVQNSRDNAWYFSYAWYARENSLTPSNQYFYPADFATRAELVDMLYRYHNHR